MLHTLVWFQNNLQHTGHIKNKFNLVKPKIILKIKQHTAHGLRPGLRYAWQGLRPIRFIKAYGHITAYGLWAGPMALWAMPATLAHI